MQISPKLLDNVDKREKKDDPKDREMRMGFRHYMHCKGCESKVGNVLLDSFYCFKAKEILLENGVRRDKMKSWKNIPFQIPSYEPV